MAQAAVGNILPAGTEGVAGAGIPRNAAAAVPLVLQSAHSPATQLTFAGALTKQAAAVDHQNFYGRSVSLMSRTAPGPSTLARSSLEAKLPSWAAQPKPGAALTEVWIVACVFCLKLL